MSSSVEIRRVDPIGVCGIDHIGLAVKSLQEALPFWRDVAGFVLQGIEDVPDQGVRTAILLAGDSRIELLEPLGDGSPLTKFLEKRGEGIHHIALGVNDVSIALARSSRAGKRLIDHSPRPGAGGTTIGFVHPGSTGGVLLEFCSRVVQAAPGEPG